MGGCVDKPGDWKSSAGSTCAKAWCTSDGDYGSGWDKSTDGSFDDWAVKGGVQTTAVTTTTENSSSSLLWLWILLGILALCCLLALCGGGLAACMGGKKKKKKSKRATRVSEPALAPV